MTLGSVITETIFIADPHAARQFGQRIRAKPPSSRPQARQASTVVEATFRSDPSRGS